MDEALARTPPEVVRIRPRPHPECSCPAVQDIKLRGFDGCSSKSHYAAGPHLQAHSPITTSNPLAARYLRSRSTAEGPILAEFEGVRVRCRRLQASLLHPRVPLSPVAARLHYLKGNDSREHPPLLPIKPFDHQTGRGAIDADGASAFRPRSG
jgi:hypothetical protein